MKRPLFYAIALLAAFGCGSSDSGTTSPPGKTDDGKPDDWAATGSDGGTASLSARPELRTGRRLSVRQVDQSIRRIFGKTWSLSAGTQSVDVFPILAPMLGQPDYLSENVESLDPTPLFSKFMDNMASSLCTDQVIADYANPPPPNPVVVKYPTDVDANLRYLRLRFHAIYVAPGSTKEIAPLKTLFTELKDNVQGLPANVPTEVIGWIGVCIAMLTDPEMMTY